MEIRMIEILKRHYKLNNIRLKDLLVRATERGFRYVVLDQKNKDYSSWRFEKDMNLVDFSFGIYVFSINSLITSLKIKDFI